MSDGRDEMCIEISWRSSGSDDWLSRSVSPLEYFEPDERSFEFDSIPRFDHAVEYLSLKRDDVAATKITLTNSKQKRSRMISEKFWNNGKNRIIERFDESDAPYWEMILESRSVEHPKTVEIMRIGRDPDGIVGPLSHVFLTEQEDGSHSEIIVYPGK